ncbi:MAG: glycosyltransferase family 4 protein [Enterococcus sp.]|nr:glycosyltransferase family 4 protein [Enterococcus sp.]
MSSLLKNRQRPKILFVCRKQFGYSIDNYFHCKYLRRYFDITYISPDVGWERVFLEGVLTEYVEFKKNKILNNLDFYLKIVLSIKKRAFELIYLNRSFFFFIFKILNPSKIFIYDIRSGIITLSSLKRYFKTSLIKLDLFFYKNVTVISDNLAKQLGIKNYHLLPLGAEEFNLPARNFNDIKLVYVGSFNNRNIEDTIEGFGLFLKDIEDPPKISYHIYGFGNLESEKKIHNAITGKGLQNFVFFHGKILHKDLPLILAKYNVGVSYIPITLYFDAQPPTKTFEYLLAGMPVIATRTIENEKIINEANGVLIQDNPEAFKDGLNNICRKIAANHFNSDKIIRNCLPYSWENIVVGNFKPYLESLLVN